VVPVSVESILRKELLIMVSITNHNSFSNYSENMNTLLSMMVAQIETLFIARSMSRSLIEFMRLYLKYGAILR